MSLRELADKAEVSASMLSQIDYFSPGPGNNPAPVEIGLNIVGEVTASELRDAKVNRAADLPVSDFESPTPPATPIVRSASRPTIELKGGVTWARLTALAESDAEFLEITYAPGATSGANMSHHDGREFGLVLEGELMIELGFESYTLHPGDSMIFDSTIPHRMINKGAQPMRALWVVLNRL